MPVPVLRPLSVGEILDVALKILFRNFLTLAKATAVVVIPAALIVAVIEGAVVTTATTVVNPTTGQIETDVRTLAGGFFAVYSVTLIAGLLASAICYKVVGDAYVGRQPGWRVALRFTARRVHSILWVAIVVFAFLGLLAFLGVVVIAALAHASAALGVLAGIGLFVVLVWLALPAGLAVPTFMMEGLKGGRAYRRAFSLVRGNWWRTFGLLLLTGILSFIVSLIVDVLFGVALRAAIGNTTAGRVLVDFLLFGVTYLCIHPFGGAVLVILSIDLRVRKEGYDIELLASQLGLDASSVSLPYARYGTGRQQAGQYGGYPVGPPSEGAPPGLPQSIYPPPGGAPVPPAPGWWMASDGRWYQPELHPSATSAPPAPGWWMASDGRWYPPELHPSATSAPPGAPSGPPPSSIPPESGAPPGPASSD